MFDPEADEIAESILESSPDSLEFEGPAAQPARSAGQVGLELPPPSPVPVQVFLDRLDNSIEAEMRRLARIDLLILDDFALQTMDQVQTADFYELVVERHQKTSTIVTSNRDPSEWIAAMSDALLAQSAVDRLVATSYELVIEGESYRRKQRPTHAPTGVSD